MKEYVLRNARVVTPTTVMHGHVLVRDGLVADVDEGDIQPTAALECIDCEGDYLLPGFVELHTDNLEKHLVPRPKVVWPQAEPAFFAHDAQIVAAGITTVFDALSVGEYHDKGRIAMLGRGVDALNHCRQSGMLRADHLLHLRCEVAPHAGPVLSPVGHALPEAGLADGPYARAAPVARYHGLSDLLQQYQILDR